MTTLPVDFQCPRCGNIGTYRQHTVDYRLPVDNNLLLTPITLEECAVCHEQLLDDTASAHLSCLAERLRKGDTQDMTPVGLEYRG